MYFDGWWYACPPPGYYYPISSSSTPYTIHASTDYSRTKFYRDLRIAVEGYTDEQFAEDLAANSAWVDEMERRALEEHARGETLEFPRDEGGETE